MASIIRPAFSRLLIPRAAGGRAMAARALGARGVYTQGAAHEDQKETQRSSFSQYMAEKAIHVGVKAGARKVSKYFSEYENDPFQVVGGELDFIADDIKTLVQSDHPVLKTVANYFFDIGGKKFRPVLVLLLSRATAAHSQATLLNLDNTRENIINTTREDHVLASQVRLAEIAELIHTASLMHDDVIDVAEKRRGKTSANTEFGNKVAVLAGDFLLARASLMLARLRDPDVIELLSTVIEHLVRGEIMQMKPGQDPVDFDYYIEKNFYKTSSLMAHSAKATALLGGHSQHVADLCYEYGRSIGNAFQIVDDILDFTAESSVLGKPTMNDMRQGISTAPVLFAAEQYPELKPMMARRFRQDGDFEKASEMVLNSNGIEQAKQFAQMHADRAVDAISELHPSDAQMSLVALTEKVLSRNK